MKTNKHRKTNKDLWLGWATIDDDLFLALITGQGKCNRCSNSYWDGTKASCHRHINESSCEEGQREYFESYPEENLQKKYGKLIFFLRMACPR